jgi:Holliday junction resolvase
VYRKGVQRKGIPDIIGIINGTFYGIEVKIGKDRQSADQKEIEQEINAAGGVYFIAKSYDDYLNKLTAANEL